MTVTVKNIPTKLDGVTLTEADLDLLRRLCFPLKVISAEMGLNYGTLRTRMSRLKLVFGVENQRALLVKALKLGLISLHELHYREYTETDNDHN